MHRASTPRPVSSFGRATIRPIAGLATALLCTAALAAPETFYGYDQGLGNNTRLATHPLGDAARAAFLARLVPGIATETFESVAVTAPVFENRSLTLTFGAQTALLVGSGLVMNSVAPSTTNPINGIASGVYPTSGTRAWLSADDFELQFTQAQMALGFYGVDIGDFNGRLVLDLVHADQTTTRLLASSGVVDSGGSVQYFGVLSLDKPFIAVRFGNTAAVGYDGFVFDDLTIAMATQVPEPTSWALMFAGLAALGGLARKRRNGAATPRRDGPFVGAAGARV